MFIGDTTADGSSRMTFEVYRSVLYAQILPNAAKLTGWCFTVQINNQHKNIQSKQPYQDKEIKYSSMVKSVTCFQPKRASFHILKTKLKAEKSKKKQQLKAAGKASQGRKLWLYPWVLAFT